MHVRCRGGIASHVDDAHPPPIRTLSLHDALPISPALALLLGLSPQGVQALGLGRPVIHSALGKPLDASVPLTLAEGEQDRKSTRLNSSHVSISYAVFCLKTKTPERRTAAYARLPH